ncbi:MAG: hypothetical protein Q8Q46_04040 [Candidatus Giovannonibacteria bacterium]|nr:hypothetical protein [Candidatus Giovannonibacteria bacterium]
MRRTIIYKPSVAESVLVALEKCNKGAIDVLLGAEPGGNKRHLRTAISRLRKRNLIFGERIGKKLVFALTEIGELEAQKITLKLQMSKPKRWDGKWRIIIFDVPEKIRGKRDLLRKELNNFGFTQLQRSVWAYPYPLPKEFVELWDNAGILKYCVVFEAVNVTDIGALKQFYFPKHP